MPVKLGEATIGSKITGKFLDVTLVFDPSREKDPYGVRFMDRDNKFLWYSSLPSPTAIMTAYDQSRV